MSGTKVAGKTIGEVEKITKIAKRELKYYIEQGLVQPSGRGESGCWLYSAEDIRRAQLCRLCRELDFPAKAIRAILADPDGRWHEEAELQILLLTQRRDRAEARLCAVRCLRDCDVWVALKRYRDEFVEP